MIPRFRTRTRTEPWQDWQYQTARETAVRERRGTVLAAAARAWPAARAAARTAEHVLTVLALITLIAVHGGLHQVLQSSPPCTASGANGSGVDEECPAQPGWYYDPQIYGSVASGAYDCGSPGTSCVLSDVFSPPAGFTNTTCASGQSGPPCQTITATDAQHWSVTTDFANAYGGQVLSYPDTQQQYAFTPLASFAGLWSAFSDNVPDPSNSYDVGYDIWGGTAPWQFDTMIWTAQSNRGGCGGNTPALTNVSFGGTNGVPVQTWNLYNYGVERIWCSTSLQETTGRIDVYDMLAYLMPPNYTGPGSLPAGYGINGIDYGVEMCYTNGTYATYSQSQFTMTIGAGGGGTLPAAATNAATGITSAGATLNGSVNPEGADTTWQFQYGTTTGYGSVIPAVPAGAGAGTGTVSENAALTGLAPSATYHYRIEATNSAGTTYGADQQFTTPALPAGPSRPAPWFFMHGWP